MRLFEINSRRCDNCGVEKHESAYGWHATDGMRHSWCRECRRRATTHDEIVLKAGWWLRERRRCCPVLLEPSYGATMEKPDAIGWRSGASTLIECKANRSDFLADRKKTHRSLGGMGSYRYYMAPVGLISIDELPEGWGLLELRGRPEKGVANTRVFILAEAEQRGLSPIDMGNERHVLAGALANVQYRDRGFRPGGGKHEEHNLGKDAWDQYRLGYDRGRERERKGAPDYLRGLQH